MSLVVLGANHKTASLERREQWSYQPVEVTTTLKRLRAKLKTEEIVLLSTCNRTEVYCDLDEPENLIYWFNAEIKPRTSLDIDKHGYFYKDKEAVSHIMRVASGLDSLVIGEPQILGQFKQAFRLAQKANTIGKKFDKLFNKTFSVAKSVRANTDIGLHAMSVASVGANLIIEESTTNHLSKINILLVGSGDTIKTVGRSLIKKNLSKINPDLELKINIVNRNNIHAHDLSEDLEKYAKEVADKDIKVATFDFSILNNAQELAKFNIILTATSSPVYLLTKEIVRDTLLAASLDSPDIMNKLILIDLAVPRDIDPECQNLDNIILYTVDDLKKILHSNTEFRSKASAEAEKIIQQYTDDFCSWESSLLFMSSLCKYRHQAELMCQDVIDRAQKKLDAGQDPKEVLTSSLQLLRNKLLHHPTTTLKSLARHKNHPELDTLKDLLDL